MKVEDILTSAEFIIQDGSYTADSLEAMLDTVALNICTIVRIPSAKRIGAFTVIAGNTSTNISDAVERFSPKFVGSARNLTADEPVKIYGSLELLFEVYPTMNEVGDIEAIAIEDYMLWTQKVPEVDQDISFIYSEVPSVPSGSEEIRWAPAGLHYNLFVCGLVGMAFGEIEDGLEAAASDGKPNTGFYASKFYEGIKDLRRYYGRSSVHLLSSFWSE
jgi:hypothetical protein